MRHVIYKVAKGILVQSIIILSLLTLSVIQSCSGNVYDEPPHRLVDHLVKGMMAYKIPDTMQIEHSYNAIASITKALNDRVLFHRIDSTDFIKEEIRVSSRVKVTLIDPSGNKNFDITALNTEEQLVDDSTNTVWRWNIKPKRGGESELVLRATVKILDRLGENYKDIDVFEKTIKVKASAFVQTKQFVSDNWKWLMTACVIPLIIWGYKKLSARKNGAAKRPLIGFGRQTGKDQ